MSGEQPTAEAVLQRVIEAVPGGVVHVDAGGAVVRANPAACGFLGYSFDRLTQRYTQDFAGDTWFEDGDPCPVEAYPVSITLTQGQAAGPTTIGVRQPTGEVRWAVFRSVPVDGGGAVVTFLDITERKRNEERLRISDRLASLGRLAAGVAHEVNNPLTSVILQLEKACALAGPEAAEVLESAQGGLDRVSKIVKDLSTFARVDDDTTEPVDLAAIVAQSLVMTEAEVQHRASLVIDIGTPPPVRGVSSRIVQILVNLVLNSAQAIRAGARDAHVIRITSEVQDTGVAVIVTDNGSGIDPADLGHVFDPFFTTKPVGEGTGLGLAISRTLAEAMGGRLTLESANDEGTRAVLWLPLADVEVPAEPRPSPRPSPGQATILVVDDEPAIRSLLAWALEPNAVRTASTGREALDLLESASFDVILCDLMMPDITGMELHRRVAPDTAQRMVFMTGGAYTPEAQDFLGSEGIRCVEKPFRAAEIRAVVREALTAD